MLAVTQKKFALGQVQNSHCGSKQNAKKTLFCSYSSPIVTLLTAWNPPIRIDDRSVVSRPRKESYLVFRRWLCRQRVKHATSSWKFHGFKYFPLCASVRAVGHSVWKKTHAASRVKQRKTAAEYFTFWLRLQFWFSGSEAAVGGRAVTALDAMAFYPYAHYR